VVEAEIVGGVETDGEGNFALNAEDRRDAHGVSVKMTSRNHFIDRLRVLLTALVITFHGAITYGSAGGWYWREVDDLSRPLRIGLTMMAAICQAYFMGMFFLLAGYFTPSSLERKGLKRFVLDRLLRLGIPLLVYGLLIGPITIALARANGLAILERFCAGYSAEEHSTGAPCGLLRRC
jgi:peptidoglycan/LPS O-acetylase OafA/YrhL